MGLLKKKPDLISDKARALESEIAALEAEIKKLDSQLPRSPSPKLRSTPTSPVETIARVQEKPAPAALKPSEPVFEKVIAAKIIEAEKPELFNELGVRKYDLPALFNRLRNHMRGPTTSNPRLVNYLAAGGVQGLRPLRYEKRVARNRFILLVIVLLVILLGLIAAFYRR